MTTAAPPRKRRVPVRTHWMLFKRFFSLRTVLRLAGWSLLAAYVFMATALTVLRFWAMPNIERLYPKLEEMIEQRLSTDIVVDNVTADWSFLQPRLTVTNLTLSRPGENASLTLPKVQITFSLTSLFKFQPVTSRLVIVEPNLQIERLTPTVFNIGGFTINTARRAPEKDESSQEKSAQSAFDPNAKTPLVFDWLLNQKHIEINNGHFSYIDYTEAHPATVQLANSYLLIHQFPLAWSVGVQTNLIGRETTPLDLRGQIKEHFWGETNRLHNLYGTLYASIPEVNFGQIADRINLDKFVQKGIGQTEVWMTFEGLRPSSITTDIKLREVSLRWTPQGEPMQFDALEGRIEQTLSETNFLEVKTHDIMVKPQGLEPYYLGDAQMQTFLKNGSFYDGELHLEYFDLAALTTIGLQLPMPEGVLDQIRAMKAGGLIENFESRWRGPINNPTTFNMSSDFKALTLNAIPLGDPENPQPPKASFTNLSGRVKATESEGEVELDSPLSALSFPTIFPEPDITFDELKLKGQWVVSPTFDFRVTDLIAQNGDASIQVHGGWKNTGDLGTLEVRGDIYYLNAANAWRYIPLVAGGLGTNDWLRGALQSGMAQNGKVDIYGPLREFPFKEKTKPEHIFRISGDIQNATLDFLPTLQKDEDGAWIASDWPRIRRINGRITFEADGMDVLIDNALATGGAKLANVQAKIPSYGAPGVPLHIKGEAHGDLSDMAQYVNESPISAMIGDLFKDAKASGEADLDLELMIPITNATQTSVNGEVRLKGNAVELKGVPPLENATGSVTFTEKGAWAPKLAATLYGQPASGSIQTDGTGRIVVLASGSVTSEVISKIIDSPATTSLFDFIEGTTYATVRVEVKDGISIHITSPLTGASINAPAPFNKAVNDVWPVVFDMQSCKDKRECAAKMDMTVADKLLTMSILYRDTPRGLSPTKGYFAVNTDSPKMPTSTGLSLYLNHNNIVWREWQPVLNHILEQRDIDPNADIKTMDLNRVVANVNRFDYDGMYFDKVNVNALLGRSQQWSGSLRSNLFKGNFIWTPGTRLTHPHLKANFDYLHVPQKQLVDKTLEQVAKVTESLPSLELAIGDLRYTDYNLGNLAVVAKNEGFGKDQSWALNHFKLTTPEATLTATGSWDSGKKQASQTRLNTTLDAKNVGKLFERAHLQDVINEGAGQINAQLHWSGAPVDFATKTLNGEASVILRSGQITQAEPGAGRILSLISLQQILRRLAFDFRDVIGKGFVFDTINGAISIKSGFMTSDSLRIVGPQATILGHGWLDLNTLNQNMKVTILPDISLSGASLAIAIANPILGVGSFLAQLALQTPLSHLLSVQYLVTGTIDEPIITKIEDNADKVVVPKKE